MTKTNKESHILQFVITESELKDIYTSINHSIGDYTLRTQLLLSKPEKDHISPEEIYEDCFILSLTNSDLDYLISIISINYQHGAGRASQIVRSSLAQGEIEREPE